MGLQQYELKMSIDGDELWYRPKRVSIPTEAHKFVSSKWHPDYTWFRLSYMVYGTAELYWLIMETNGITDPYGMENGDELRILLPDFINELEDQEDL